MDKSLYTGRESLWWALGLGVSTLPVTLFQKKQLTIINSRI